ncbi:hypothetical protein [Saccharothrix sp. HUAS TT1]|uniref:hypothetical protein n=1 Tax=unclassified Saccharothrix TaxID=2593673 RepID=UPI00345C4885
MGSTLRVSEAMQDALLGIARGQAWSIAPQTWAALVRREFVPHDYADELTPEGWRAGADHWQEFWPIVAYRVGEAGRVRRVDVACELAYQAATRSHPGYPNYPMKDANGLTYWACCVSSIGPACQHNVLPGVPKAWLPDHPAV